MILIYIVKSFGICSITYTLYMKLYGLETTLLVFSCPSES